MAVKFVFFVTLASVILASYLTYAKNSTVKCHKNAEFVKCASPCPLTCLDVLEKTTPSCTEKCKPDCVCKKGYATSRGYCIKEKECKESYKPHKSSKSSKKESKKDDKKDKKSKCPQHADYKRCSSLCPPTCASIQAKDRKNSCAPRCGEPKCQCFFGYVWNGEKCLLPKDCPKVNKE